MFPEDAPSYEIVVATEVNGTPEARRAFAQDLANFMAPAETRDIEGWLAELSVIVARREYGEVDEALRLEAYASRLRQFPADIVRHVLVARTWRFWPTWEELEKACRAMASGRRSMVAALMREPEAPPPPRPVLSEEELQRLAAETAAIIEGLKARVAEEASPSRERHWSETAKPDDPRWEMLRKSRAANPIVKAASA
jgi:hypothetical protein